MKKLNFVNYKKFEMTHPSFRANFSTTTIQQDSSIDTFKVSDADMNLHDLISSMSGFMSSVEYSGIHTPLKCDESPMICAKPSVILKNITQKQRNCQRRDSFDAEAPNPEESAELFKKQLQNDDENNISNC